MKYSILSLFLLTSLGASQAYDGHDQQGCGSKLAPLFEEHSALNSSQILSAVMKLENQCSRSGAYELALSTAYYGAGRYQDAERAAEAGLQLPNSDQERLTYALFNAHAGLKDWSGAKLTADSLIASHPNSSISHLLVGRYFNGTGDPGRAIPELELSNSITPGSEALENLTIAYYNVNRFKESTESFEKSLKLNRRALSIPNVVLAAAASYYAQGLIPQSRSAIDQHLAIAPESRDNPLVIKMLGILNTPK